jgi:hypothetical protein
MSGRVGKLAVMLLLGVLLAGAGMLAASPALAEGGSGSLTEVTVIWEPPTARLDGMPIDPAADIAHYTLYCAQQSNVPHENGYVIPGMTDDGTHVAAMTEVFRHGYGDYFCVMTATPVIGGESPPSNIAEFTWPPAASGSPTQLLIIRIE